MGGCGRERLAAASGASSGGEGRAWASAPTAQSLPEALNFAVCVVFRRKEWREQEFSWETCTSGSWFAPKILLTLLVCPALSRRHLDGDKDTLPHGPCDAHQIGALQAL
jgi:hypothetical protein